MNMDMSKQLTLALSVALALTACDDNDTKNTTNKDKVRDTTSPTKENMTTIDGYFNTLLVDLENIEIVLPEDRLFHLDAKAVCPSLVTDVDTKTGAINIADDYKKACRAVIADKAQYYVDIYACRGKGDTFYAYMPTSTLEAALPFTSHEITSDINPETLFEEQNMKIRYENFGNDEFTVYSANRTGTAVRSFTAAMESYIEQGRGNHNPTDNKGPVCTSNFKYKPD